VKSRSSSTIVVVLAIVAAACGGGESVDTTTTDAPTTTTVAETTTTVAAEPTTTALAGRTFTGADGVETEITDVSRIVSLNGDITEIIFELGLGESVVGVDVTTTYPEEAAALNDSGQTVGFAQQLAPEAVLRFEPTLVIGDTQVAPSEAVEQLRAAGVPVVIIETQTALGGVETKILEIAEILATPDEGEALAERVNGEIETAQARVANDESDPVVAFVYARGPQVVFLFGAGMPTQAMIEGAGAIDAGVASGVAGPAPLTPEALVAAAPQVIVLPEAGLGALGGIEALMEIPGIAETPAGQSGDFLTYDEAFFFNLGPRAGQALDQFISDLYPDLAS
jgi:iron complex transport system substrate-binding protein